MKNHQLSKYISLLLRHKPEALGITLEPTGWTDVNEMLRKMQEKGIKVDLAQLQEVVAKDNKQRYSFNADQTKIRANQGHSIDVDLGFEPQTPPEFLYHGTATRFLASIQKTGLESRSRQHVHLSDNLETAQKVGKRHGKPVILTVRAKELQELGQHFFLSENGVWLTGKVMVEFIEFP